MEPDNSRIVEKIPDYEAKNITKIMKNFNSRINNSQILIKQNNL